MRKSARTIAGFILAPMVPGVVATLLSPVSIGEPYWTIYLFLSAVLGYPVAIVLGIPIHLVLARCRWQSLPVYLAFGPLMGCGAMLVLPTGTYLRGGASGIDLAAFALPQFWVAMIFATIATVSFWLIARPDRPSRRQTPVDPTIATGA